MDLKTFFHNYIIMPFKRLFVTNEERILLFSQRNLHPEDYEVGRPKNIFARWRPGKVLQELGELKKMLRKRGEKQLPDFEYIDVMPKEEKIIRTSKLGKAWTFLVMLFLGGAPAPGGYGALIALDLITPNFMPDLLAVSGVFLLLGSLAGLDSIFSLIRKERQNRRLLRAYRKGVLLFEKRIQYLQEQIDVHIKRYNDYSQQVKEQIRIRHVALSLAVPTLTEKVALPESVKEKESSFNQIMTKLAQQSTELEEIAGRFEPLEDFEDNFSQSDHEIEDDVIRQGGICELMKKIHSKEILIFIGATASFLAVSTGVLTLKDSYVGEHQPLSKAQLIGVLGFSWLGLSATAVTWLKYVSNHTKASHNLVSSMKKLFGIYDDQESALADALGVTAIACEQAERINYIRRR